MVFRWFRAFVSVCSLIVVSTLPDAFDSFVLDRSDPRDAATQLLEIGRRLHFFRRLGEAQHEQLLDRIVELRLKLLIVERSQAADFLHDVL